MVDMQQHDDKKLLSRSNILAWAPSLAGVLLVSVIFGSKNGLVGLIWSIGPILVGLLFLPVFFLFGRFLSQKMKWQPQLLILTASAIVTVSIAFFMLILFTAEDPGKEFGYFVPGGTIFFLILLFSGFLATLGMFARSR
jgi:drug/metabolite transporter (DMT)-like permease